jgi:all-trans-retinol dehydrogenase (NAD+)
MSIQNALKQPINQLLQQISNLKSIRPDEALPLIRRLASIPAIRKIFIFITAMTLLCKINATLNSLVLNNFTRRRPWNWVEEIAVVTGGSSGIGESIVRKLAKECRYVLALDLQPPNLPFPDNVCYYKVDITVLTDVHEVAEEIRRDFGEPTVLINNAGVGYGKSILQGVEGEIRRTFDVNIISHFFLVKEFLPSMVKNDHGHIVTIASMASFVTIGSIVDYSCTKAAALAFHEGLGQELKHIYNAKNVRKR